MTFCFYPYPPFLLRKSWKFYEIFYLSFSFHDMQIGCFAFLSLASIIVQLESALNNLYSHTWNQSIILCKLWVNLIHNRWLFTKYVLFVFCLFTFKLSVRERALFSLICRFLLLKILNCNVVVSRWTRVNNRFCKCDTVFSIIRT